MANQTSIIDIQVNDSSFQSYLASVREYRDLLRQSGAELQKALEGVDGSSGQNKALKEELKTRKAIAKASEDAENRQNTRLRDRIRLTLAAGRDGAEAAKLQAIGVGTSCSDPSKILTSLAPALRKFRNDHQGQSERAVFEGMQLGNLVETADLLGRTSADEVNAIPGTVEQNAQRHQEAYFNAGRRHDEWTATKLNTLAPVVEGMTQDAEKAQEHLNDLAISASKAASSLDSLTDGNGALVGGIAAALGPSVLKAAGLKALPKLGGALLGSSVAGPLLRMTGPAGTIITALTPHELETDDTFDMAHRNPGSVRRVTASSGTSDADLDRLTGAVAIVENHGDPNPTSPAGAQGLLQTMPGTFYSLGGTNPFDPQPSCQIGQKYLKQLLGKYHDTEKALAAYNWGPGNLDRDIRQRGDNWRDELRKETRDYIPRIMNNLQNNTIIRIENYSGQDLSVAARQGAVL